MNIDSYNNLHGQGYQSQSKKLIAKGNTMHDSIYATLSDKICVVRKQISVYRGLKLKEMVRL